MVYQIAIEMNRKNFTISESALRNVVSWISVGLLIIVFIELCIAIFSFGLWILSVIGFGSIDKTTELLLWTMCVLVWTMIPCLLYDIIERDLVVPDNCIYKEVKRIKRRGGYYYVQ